MLACRPSPWLVLRIGMPIDTGTPGRLAAEPLPVRVPLPWGVPLVEAGSATLLVVAGVSGGSASADVLECAGADGVAAAKRTALTPPAAISVSEPRISRI